MSVSARNKMNRKIQQARQQQLNEAIAQLDRIDDAISSVETALWRLEERLTKLPEEARDQLRSALNGGLERLTAQYVIQTVQLFGAPAADLRDQSEADAVEQLREEAEAEAAEAGELQRLASEGLVANILEIKDLPADASESAAEDWPDVAQVTCYDAESISQVMDNPEAYHLTTEYQGN